MDDFDDDFSLANDLQRELERYAERHGLDLPDVEELAQTLAGTAESAYGM